MSGNVFHSSRLLVIGRTNKRRILAMAHIKTAAGLASLVCVSTSVMLLTSCGSTGGGGSSTNPQQPASPGRQFFEALMGMGDASKTTGTDGDRAEKNAVPITNITPAKVTPSKDPAVKYHTLRVMWDIEKDVETYADSIKQDAGFDLTTRRSNPYVRYIVPVYKAQMTLVDKDSFDAVTLQDVQNAKFYSGGVRPAVDPDWSDKLSFSDVVVERSHSPAVGQNLTVGHILAIKTNGGKYVKAQIIGWEGIEARRTDKCYRGLDRTQYVDLEILGWQADRKKTFSYNLVKGVAERADYMERYSPKLQYVVFP